MPPKRQKWVGADLHKGTLFRTLGSGGARRGGWWLCPVPLSAWAGAGGECPPPVPGAVLHLDVN